MATLTSQICVYGLQKNCTVRCAVSSPGIVGPTFLEDNVTAHQFLQGVGVSF